MLKSGNHCI